MYQPPHARSERNWEAENKSVSIHSGSSQSMCRSWGVIWGKNAWRGFRHVDTLIPSGKDPEAELLFSFPFSLPDSNNIDRKNLCLLSADCNHPFPYAYETQDRVFEGVLRVAFKLFHGKQKMLPRMKMRNWIKSLIVNWLFFKMTWELLKLLYPDFIPEKLNESSLGS